eukprot:5184161-Pyramimonas_sp.AAC.1
MAGSSRSRRAAVRSEADLEDEPTGSKRGPPEEEEEEEEEEVVVFRMVSELKGQDKHLANQTNPERESWVY